MKLKLILGESKEEHIPVFLREEAGGIALQIRYEGLWTLGILLLDSEGKIDFVRSPVAAPLTEKVATEVVKDDQYIRVLED